MTSGPSFPVVRRFEGKTREDGVGHGQDAWAALSEKFDGCSCEALRAVHREMKVVKMWSDEDPDGFFDKKDRWRDHLNSVTPKEGPLDCLYEDIILQCLPPEYDGSARRSLREKITTCRFSAANVEDLRRRPRPLSLRLVKRHRGAWRRHASDEARPQQHKLPLLQQVWPL